MIPKMPVFPELWSCTELSQEICSFYTPWSWTVGLKYASVNLPFLQRVYAYGQLQMTGILFWWDFGSLYCGISHPILSEHLSRIPCVSPWQIFFLLLMWSDCVCKVPSCMWIGLLRLFDLSWSCPVLFLYTNNSSVFCCRMSCHCYWGLELGNPDKTGWKILSRFVWAPAALPHEKATCLQPAVSTVCSAYASVLFKRFSCKTHPFHSFSQEVLNEDGGWPCQLL